MFYIILVFVKIVFFNMYDFTKRLITYQSEHQSMVHLFICHYSFFFFSNIVWSWYEPFLDIFCHCAVVSPRKKQHVKFMVQFVTRRRDSLSMSGRYYHTYWQLQRGVVQVCTCYVSITVTWSSVANSLETTIHLP